MKRPPVRTKNYCDDWLELRELPEPVELTELSELPELLTLVTLLEFSELPELVTLLELRELLELEELAAPQSRVRIRMCNSRCCLIQSLCHCLCSSVVLPLPLRRALCSAL